MVKEGRQGEKEVNRGRGEFTDAETDTELAEYYINLAGRSKEII